MPPDGVKVRCSRCKHSFEVYPEGARPATEAADEDALHAIAERAAATDGIPDVTEDALEAPAPSLADESADPALAAESEVPDPTLEADEASWEFGDGFDDLGGDPGDSAASPSGPVTGLASTAEGDSGLELGGEPPQSDETSELAADLAGDLPLHGSSDADSDAAAASGVFESGDIDEAPEPPADAGPGLGSEPATDASDELGSPDDWDLFDAEPASAASSAPAGAGTFAIEPPAQTGSSDFLAEPVISEADEPDDRLIWVRRASTAAGWLATAGLCAAGLVHGLWPAAVEAPAPAAAGEGWALEEVEGRWVDHLSRGPVFAVSGKVRNTAESTRELPALEVVWRDRAGAAVGRPTPLAVPRSEMALREAPLDAGGRSPLTGTALRPGSGMRFLALAAGLPYAADRFEVRPRRAEAAQDAAAD